MLSLKLFNAVLIPDNAPKRDNLRLEVTLPYGLVLTPEIAGLPTTTVHDIIMYYEENKVSGEKLNRTFHKSWRKIQDSSREELLGEQLIHYFTTYGLKNLGLYSEDTIFIPNEVLEVPGVDQLPLKVVKGITRDEMVQKCMDILESGVALKTETIEEVLTILDELDFRFTTLDNIKNKEAKLILCVKTGVLPTNNSEFMRYLIYVSTQTTIVINDRKTLFMIEESKLDISKLVMEYGIERFSESFLRYKDILLAFKRASKTNAKVINRLRKLAVKNHKPMPVDFVNTFTGNDNYTVDELIEELDKVNNFRKIRLLYAIHDRLQDTDVSLYQIRNGSSFVRRSKKTKVDLQVKYDLVYKHLVAGLGLDGLKVKLPKGIEYVLPTTEKQFIGNIPAGSYVDVKKDAIVGIYWEDAGGASDLDLSSVALEKVGWDSNYKNDNRSLLFSGDITSAPNGATESFYIKDTLDMPYLIVNNVFDGEPDSKFRLFVAKENVRDFGNDYTTNPNNVIFQVDSVMNETQKVLGIVIPRNEGVRFVLTDVNMNRGITSRVSDVTHMTREFLFQTNKQKISLTQLLRDAGCVFVTEDADVDLGPENLEKNTILDLFAPKKVAVPA